LSEYRKYIEKDSAFERRFQQVYVGEVLRAAICPCAAAASCSSQCFKPTVKNSTIFLYNQDAVT
jgi:hypothetical protein